jgi:hypothetical protein
MAKDDNGERYKEGVDFEWVKAKGSNYKTRRFFSKAEKRARAEKENAAKATTDDKPTGSTRRSTESTASTSKASTRPKPRPARNNTGTPKPPSGDGPAFEKKGRGGNPMGQSTRGLESAMRQRSLRNGKGFGSGSILLPPSPNPTAKDKSNQRREAKQKAREEALAAGGRVSPLGRMIDRAFNNEAQAAKNKSRSSKRTGGMAKGGLVKANCGASMKPTQKKFGKGKK